MSNEEFFNTIESCIGGYGFNFQIYKCCNFKEGTIFNIPYELVGKKYIYKPHDKNMKNMLVTVDDEGMLVDMDDNDFDIHTILHTFVNTVFDKDLISNLTQDEKNSYVMVKDDKLVDLNGNDVTVVELDFPGEKMYENLTKFITIKRIYLPSFNKIDLDQLPDSLEVLSCGHDGFYPYEYIDSKNHPKFVDKLGRFKNLKILEVCGYHCPYNEEDEKKIKTMIPGVQITKYL